MTPVWLPYALGLAASVSTYAGGLLALRFGSRRNLLFGLTGGMVIGLALLDLLPEAVDGASIEAADAIFGAAAFGMGLYILLHRLPGGTAITRLSLIAHSVMDGLGIGLAFQVSDATGWLVTIAVLAHDMADGANIVSVSAAVNDAGSSHRWLRINALAPLAGVIVGQAMQIDEGHLALLLALFAGGFLYIGASELLPRSGGSRRAGIAGMTGIGIVALVVHFAGA